MFLRSFLCLYLVFFVNLTPGSAEYGQCEQALNKQTFITMEHCCYLQESCLSKYCGTGDPMLPPYFPQERRLENFG